MAGLYIHIPFCAKRCLYCDFFSTVGMKEKDRYIDALINEMEIRKAYLNGEPIETIYFGGGTPSQLSASDLERIFTAIASNFDIRSVREVTLEANPDDIDPDYIKSLRPLPFNRISMGVQSFDNDDLQFLNRRHDRQQAIDAVKLCLDQGYTNISIDLMYGLPGQTADKWEKNIDEFLQLDVPHLSAYHLIYEEGTQLYRLREAGKISPVDEELSLSLFSILIDRLQKAGYIHYEISNFARPGYLSQHNSSYWSGSKYLGLGPSAHSYNGIEREWNVSSLKDYLNGIRAGSPVIEKEILDVKTRYNEYIITGLRTMWGINYAKIRELFGQQMSYYCQQQAENYIKKGFLTEKEGNLTLSREGIFISDGIMSDLLYV